MSKKKICWVTPDCFMDVDMTVVRHLAKDFQIVWYYICEETLKKPRFGRYPAQLYAYKYGIELYVLDPKMRKRDLRNFIFYKELAEEINEKNPDIVFHTVRDPYWSLAIKFFMNCKNVVLGIHDVKPHSYSFTIGQFLDTSTKGLSLKVHKYYVTFSPNQHDLLLSAYGKKSEMVGMSSRNFGKSDKVLAAISEGVKLLFFGTINKYKGLDLLIDTLEELRTEGVKNISLMIAGRGSFWSKCKTLIKTSEMYDLQVRFVENSEIPDLMSSHHFLVLPYRDATQSGPLVTAVAYELPIIAPSYGCFTETYDKNSAILYPQGELKTALRKVSELTQEDYNTMKHACAIVKEANSEERIAQNYINYFNTLN